MTTLAQKLNDIANNSIKDQNIQLNNQIDKLYKFITDKCAGLASHGKFVYSIQILVNLQNKNEVKFGVPHDIYKINASSSFQTEIFDQIKERLTSDGFKVDICESNCSEARNVFKISW